jgi:hypothetical protein
VTAPLKPGDVLKNNGIEISRDAAADFHMILAAFIADGVEKMAAFGNSYPPDLTFECWQEICAEIVAGFRGYVQESGLDDESSENLNKSLDLLRAWFPHLWD